MTRVQSLGKVKLTDWKTSKIELFYLEVYKPRALHSDESSDFEVTVLKSLLYHWLASR